MKKIMGRCILFLLYCSYFTAVFFDADLLCNLISPIVTLLTAYVVYRSFCRRGSTLQHYISELFIFLAILTWGICDVMWAVCEHILHINPEEVVVITYGYVVTNLCLMVSLAVFGYHELRRWNIFHIILDTMTLIFVIGELLWFFLLDERFSNLKLLNGDPSASISLITDIVIISWIFIWFMSIRSGRVPRHMYFLAGGGFLFAITDIVYLYQYFFSDYNPNSLIDAVYLLSFGLYAIAAYLQSDSKEAMYSAASNTGQGKRRYLLLLVPVTIIIFKGYDPANLLQITLIILIYFMLTVYIQRNIEKELMLKKEQEQNNHLELKVAERTEELIEKNLALEELVSHDQITGLKNRRSLNVFLQSAKDSLDKNETILLLYIDINKYKMIITMFGHYIAEKVLAEMAQRLQLLENEDKNAMLATYGEDMFIYAVKGSYDYSQAHMLAMKAILYGSDIYRIDDYQIKITVNIGISIYPYDAADMQELIKHADIAMSHARTMGFNTIQEYDKKLSDSFFRRNLIEILLKKVNMDQEFMIYYQPQFNISDGALLGFEALLRWRSLEGEMIGPGEFIPIAEETGYIVSIGEWVMKNALRQLMEWNQRSAKKIRIGINVSQKQLITLHFAEKLYQEVARLKLNPKWIDLEITESLHLQENPDILKTLENFRKFGIAVSIDDFGTGFSSLSYLKSLPVNRIKLARELVSSVHTDEFDYKLVKSIIELSKAKGIKVIAEGVETQEQLDTLKQLDCDEIQGFLMGRPLPVAEIEEKYQDFKPNHHSHT